MSAETVRRTPLAEQHITVVTLRRHDSYLLRPYLVFARDDLSGKVSLVVDFSCEAAALHAHNEFGEKKMERSLRTAAPKLRKGRNHETAPRVRLRHVNLNEKF